jgi:hypothetical protein
LFSSSRTRPEWLISTLGHSRLRIGSGSGDY